MQFTSSNKLRVFYKYWVLECASLSILYYVLLGMGYSMVVYINSKIYGPDINVGSDLPVNTNYWHIATPLDYLFPYINFFILPYLSAFAIWIICPFLIYGFCGRKVFYRFMTMVLFCGIISIVCAIIFPISLPSDFQMQAFNASKQGAGVFNALVKMTYSHETLAGACPSMHWAKSVVIIIAVWNSLFDKKNMTKLKLWTIILMIFFNVLVCISTIFTKQHTVIDALVAIVICEICWLIAKYTPIANWLNSTFSKWNDDLRISGDSYLRSKTIAVKKKIIKGICWWLFLIIMIANLFIQFGFGFMDTSLVLLETIANLSAMAIWIIIIALYYLIPHKRNKNFMNQNTHKLMFTK